MKLHPTSTIPDDAVIRTTREPIRQHANMLSVWRLAREHEPITVGFLITLTEWLWPRNEDREDIHRDLVTFYIRDRRYFDVQVPAPAEQGEE